MNFEEWWKKENKDKLFDQSNKLLAEQAWNSARSSKIKETLDRIKKIKFTIVPGYKS